MNKIPPVIGETWQGEGGVYSGIIRNHKTGEQWHLVLAVSEESKFSCEYGCYGDDIEGATDFTDGKKNTQALINSDSPAAKALAALNIDGHDDWYLPAQKELNLLYINLQDHMEPEWHWSSTQYSANYAWDQDCDNGTQIIRNKVTELAVRAVRRLSI